MASAVGGSGVCALQQELVVSAASVEGAADARCWTAAVQSRRHTQPALLVLAAASNLELYELRTPPILASSSEQLSSSREEIRSLHLLEDKSSDTIGGVWKTLAVVHIGSRLAFVRIPSLQSEPSTLLPMSSRETVQKVAVDDLRLVVFTTSKVFIFDVDLMKDPIEIRLVEKLGFSAKVSSACVRDGTVCCASKESYYVLRLGSGSGFTALPVPLAGANACCAILPPDHLLLSTNTQLGIFLDLQGHPLPMNPLAWSSNPLSLCVFGDHAAALLPGGTIEVFSLSDQVLLQTLAVDPSAVLLLPAPLTKPDQVGSLQSAFVLCPQALYRLSPAPIEEQITQYLSHFRFQEAKALFVRERRSASSMREFYIRGGLILFANLLFEESFGLLESRLSVSDLVQLCPSMAAPFYSGAITLLPDGPYASLLSLAAKARPRIEAMVASPHVSKAHRVLLEKVLSMSDDEIVASAQIHLARTLWSRRPQSSSKDLVIIDTVLLRLRSTLCDSVELPYSLTSLLSASNECLLSASEKLLQDRGDIRSLALLYEANDAATKSLAIWSELADDNAAEHTARLLLKNYLSEEEVVFEFLEWLCRAKPGYALRLLTHADMSIAPTALLHYLQGLGLPDETVLRGFLEEFVLKRKCEEPELHNGLLRIYTDAALEEATPIEEGASGQVVSHRRESCSRLRSLLNSSVCYDPWPAIERLKGTELHEERALLYEVAGEHAEVLNVYVYELGDYNSAAHYCRQVSETDAATPCLDAFPMLFRMLYAPDLKRIRGSESASSLRAASQRILYDNADVIPALEVVQLLPEDTPVQDVSGLLRRLLPASASRRRLRQIERALCKSQHLELNHTLSVLESESVRIDESTRCCVCDKLIGSVVFCYEPSSGKPRHYSCFS